jgi:hypothetical protein
MARGTVGGPNSVPDTAHQARLDDRLVHRDERGLVDASGRNDQPIRWVSVRPLQLRSADGNPRAQREQLQTSVFTKRGINPDRGGAVKLQFARTCLHRHFPDANRRDADVLGLLEGANRPPSKLLGFAQPPHPGVCIEDYHELPVTRTNCHYLNDSHPNRRRLERADRLRTAGCHVDGDGGTAFPESSAESNGIDFPDGWAAIVARPSFCHRVHRARGGHAATRGPNLSARFDRQRVRALPPCAPPAARRRALASAKHEGTDVKRSGANLSELHVGREDQPLSVGDAALHVAEADGIVRRLKAREG